MTYDAAIAMAKSDPHWKPGMPLLFYAKETTLANANDRSVDQESEAIDSLVRDKWFEKRGRLGSHGPKCFLILEHEEYAAKYGGCPPNRYDPENGEKLVKGTAPADFAQPTIRRILKPLAGLLAGLSEEQRAKVRAYWQEMESETPPPPDPEKRRAVIARAESVRGKPLARSVRGNPRNGKDIGPGKSPERNDAGSGESPLSVRGNPPYRSGEIPGEAGIKPVPEHNPNPQPVLKPGAAGRWLAKNLAAMNNEQPRGEQRKQIEALAEKIGLRKMDLLLQKFLQRPGGVDGLTKPVAWRWFLESADLLIIANQIDAAAKEKEKQAAQQIVAGAIELFDREVAALGPLSESEKAEVEECRQAAQRGNTAISWVECRVAAIACIENARAAAERAEQDESAARQRASLFGDEDPPK